MKKLTVKMKKLRLTPWNKLTTGEKAAKVVLKLVKWAAIAAVVATVAVAVIGTLAAVIFAVCVAFGIAGAISGGLMDASRAYRPGDYYVRFR